MRRKLIMLAALLGGFTVMLGIGATPAWADGEAVQGTLKHDGEPVAGVTITVSAEDGSPIATVESDGDGTWSVPLPSGGTYQVMLDESTLPDGLAVSNGRPVLSPQVREGRAQTVLFPLGTGVTVTQPTPGQDSGGEPPPAEPGDEAAEDEAEAEPEVVTRGGGLNRVVSHVYSGIHFGLIIALAALGLSLIFGTMGLTNFAHGELVSFGALAALVLHVTGVFGVTVPLVLAAVLAVGLGALFGYTQDRFFWGPLRRRGTGLIAMMIISIGVALLLRNGYLYYFGGERQRYRDFSVQQPIEIGPLTVAPKTLVADGVALVVLLAVTLALVLTRLGKATRAVADNPALAAASGINVDRIVRLVWAIGAGLAALAGVILAVEQGASFQMGFQILLLIFAAVVVGGLGTAFGAVVGALIVGLFIQVSTLWIANELKYVGALALLIVVLLIRPQGLLGRRERIG